MDGRNRSDVARGADVSVVLKEDQPPGKLTRAIVQDLLTNSPFHPHGIKVRLQDGKVGRIQAIHSAGRGQRGWVLHASPHGAAKTSRNSPSSIWAGQRISLP